WTKGAAWVALAAPIAWAPGPGVAAAVCGLALWRPKIALGLALPVGAVLAWHFHEPVGGIALQAVWLLLLVPAAILPGREGIAAGGGALLLAGQGAPGPGWAPLP